MSTLGCVTGFLEVPRTASRTISPSNQCLSFTQAAGAKGLSAGSLGLVSYSPDLHLLCVRKQSWGGTVMKVSQGSLEAVRMKWPCMASLSER